MSEVRPVCLDFKARWLLATSSLDADLSAKIGFM